MKKNILKVLATTFAVGLFVASPSATITSHAFGFNADANDTSNRGTDDDADAFWDAYQNGSNDSSSDTVVDYDEPSQPEYTEPAQPANTGSSSSSANESYSGGSSSNSASSNTASGNGGSTVSAPSTAKDPNAFNVQVTGGQKFRITKDPTRSIFNIYHMGDRKVSFVAKDEDGNEVSYSTINLEKGDDGLWYLNVTYPATVDTTTITMEVRTGDETYLSTTLGVSGVKMNGTLAVSTVPVAETEAETETK